MNKLVISLATRNRPQFLFETVKRTVTNCTNANTQIVIQADADDYATLGLLTDKGSQFDARVTINVQKREDTIAAKWNRALTIPADVYLIAADDDPCVTEGFDQKILDAAALFPDGIGMVFGHPANASFSNFIGCTRKWCDLLGYIVPEHFPYWFCDHWIDDIARITGRIAFADVKGDQSKVPGTQELREPSWWATWFDANYLRRRVEAHKIIDALDEPDWRKQILRSHHPLIEFRSKWINDNVRTQARGLEAASGSLSLLDPRYQRVKTSAMEALPNILRELPPDEAQRYATMLVPPQFMVSPPQAYAPLRIVG